LVCHHDPIRLWLYVGGALETGEAEAVAVHLAECTACQHEANRAREQLGLVLLAEPPVQPPQRLRAGPGAGGSNVAGGPDAADPPATSPASTEQREPLSPEKRRLAELSRAHDQHRTIRQLLRAETAQIVPLTGGEADQSQAVRGRLLWDSARKEGYIFAPNLEPPKAGHRYTLWLIGRNGQSVAVRSFSPEPEQTRPIAFALPASAPVIDSIVRASIGVGPADESTQDRNGPQRPMLTGKFSPNDATN
jgi:anti-sigma factor RsiW